MKSLYKSLPLAVLAAFALSVAVSATAFAATTPEFVKKGGGALVKKKFTIAAAGVGYEFASGAKYICRSVTGEGEVTSKTTVGKVVLEFHECSQSCQTEKSIVKTEPMKGVFGWINEASKEIGLQLRGEVERKFPFEPLLLNDVRCASASFNVEGSLMGIYTGALKSPSKVQSFTYAQSKSKQEFKPFTGSSPIAEILGSEKRQSIGFELKNALTFEEEGEFVES